MSTISEEEWKAALIEILEDLDNSQYDKMLEFLDIPQYVKTTKSREQMPQTIIEHYGVETSIDKINKTMDQIPRRDRAVQDRLRPFVDKLKNKQGDEKKGKKRKHSETVLKSADKKDEAGEQKSCQPDKTDPAGPEKPKKKTTENRDSSLKSTRATRTRKMSMISEKDWKKALIAILGKLNNPQYDKMLKFLKIPKQKKTAKFKEQMPQKLIERYGVETSIHRIKEAMDRIPRKDDAVQKHLRPFVDKLINKQENKKKGQRKSCQPDKEKIMPDFSSNQSKRKVEKADPAGPAKPKKKTENRDSSLESAGAKTNPPREAAVPSLHSTNPAEPVKPKVNRDSCLNLNGATRTPKVQSAPVQTAKVKIKAVTAINKTNTHLVVQVKTQLKEVFVTTRLLAEALGYKMEDGVEARIRDAMPISAEAKMQGKKIIEIKKT